MEIDHNPYEKRYTNTVWWVAWIGVGLLWIWYLNFFDFQWIPIVLGGLTMGVLVAWVNEVEQNKKARSSRPRKPPTL